MMVISKIIPAGFILLFFCSPVLAWVHAAPNEVIFFTDADFQGESLTLRLQPGIRHRLRPGLGEMDRKISSILVGDNVKVFVFTNPDFRGAVREYVYTIPAHMPDDDQISSLIVCPKDEPPQGVLFIQKRLSEVKNLPKSSWNYITGQGMFFPLPESDQETAAKFLDLSGDGGKSARYVYVSPTVELTLFAGPQLTGRSLTLPGSNSGQQTVFDLTSYGFYDLKKSPPGAVTSLIVTSRGSGKK